MRPTLLFTLAATLTGMVSAQYGAELYARDVDGSDAWAGLVRRAAEPEPFALHAAVDDLLEENPHLVRRMSDVFRAVRSRPSLPGPALPFPGPAWLTRSRTGREQIRQLPPQARGPHEHGRGARVRASVQGHLRALGLRSGHAWEKGND